MPLVREANCWHCACLPACALALDSGTAIRVGAATGEHEDDDDDEVVGRDEAAVEGAARGESAERLGGQCYAVLWLREGERRGECGGTKGRTLVM